MVPLSKTDELLACIFLALFPGCMMWAVAFGLLYLSPPHTENLSVIPYLLSTHHFNRTLAAIAIWPFSIFSWIVPALLIGSIFFPQKRAYLGPMTVRWQASCAALLMRYFSFRMVVSEDLDFEHFTPTIFSTSPHGVFPMGTVLTYWALEGLCHVRVTPTSATSLLWSPIVRHWVLRVGTIPANYGRLLRELKSGKSVGIVLGGIAEIFEFDHPVALVSHRKGFVRLASDAQARIIPAYVFGDRNLLDCLKDKGGWLQWISRKLRFPITLFWGRFFLPIPRRRNIACVLGSPIADFLVKDTLPQDHSQWSVEEKDKFQGEKIGRVHRQYQETLLAIFETFKDFFPNEDNTASLRLE